jgi:seryl-tRNA synthetase
MKVEQFIYCKNDPAESEKWHQVLLETSEEIVRDLELPYRVVECCTGDMGAGKVRMFDVEAWVPSEQKYRETHSCSALHDWQSRRTQTRYRDSDNKVQYVHTLNNTAIATPRILVPFLENHQQADGTVEYFLGMYLPN